MDAINRCAMVKDKAKSIANLHSSSLKFSLYTEDLPLFEYIWGFKTVEHHFLIALGLFETALKIIKIYEKFERIFKTCSKVNTH